MAVTTFVDRVVLHVAAGRRRQRLRLGPPREVQAARRPRRRQRRPRRRRHPRRRPATSPRCSTTTTARTARPTNGKPGAGDHRNGADGDDLVLPVPDGTVVHRRRRARCSPTWSAPGTELVVAEGGRGGLGNAALASTRRKAPGFALLGEPGDARDVVSSSRPSPTSAWSASRAPGKSSLVAAMSAARPKIADYPFTTLVPNLGVVTAGDTRFTVADVPGLIQGASEGKGLGLEFLRHVERCAALVHVVDCATLEPGRDPLTDLDVIEARARGVRRARATAAAVASTRSTCPRRRELAEMVRADLEARGLQVFASSAASHEGLRELSFAMAEVVECGPRRAPAAGGAPPGSCCAAGRSTDRDFTVTARATATRSCACAATKPERWVRQTDFSNDEAVGFLADRLNRLGVEDAAARARRAPRATTS